MQACNRVQKRVQVRSGAIEFVQVCLGVSRCTSHPHDLGVAAGTGGGEELLIAILAVHTVLLLHEADVSQ